MNAKTILIPAVAFLLGGAAAWGFFFHKAATPVHPIEEADDLPRKKGQIVAASQDDLVASMRARIRELEAELAQRAAVPVQDEAEKVADRRPEGRQRRSPFEGMREHMERLKKEDPEAYAQMEESRKAFMKQRQEEAQSRLAFLSLVDVDALSEDAKANHLRMTELLTTREEILSQITDPDLADEERQALMMSLRETEFGIRQGSAMERETLLSAVAGELGLTGDDAAGFVETMNRINDVTNSGRGGPPPRGPQGGGMPGGPQGGGMPMPR